MTEIRNDKNEDKIRRFSTARIIEHWLFFITFGILILTGLSQKFYLLDMSQWFVLKLGGIDNIRLLHRCAGVVLLGATATHIFIAIFGIILQKYQPAMVITKKDFADAVHNIKYYIGMKDHQAFCARYNYKQKFEYWLVLTGTVIMVASGLILWFPTLVAQFLPGESIPVAKALHTNQALLMFLIIAVWHIYNAIFRPEVFPLDTSIFTGYISRERMVREHPLELARVEGISLEKITGRQTQDISELESGEIP